MDRQTTEEEDGAYSLLGILNMFMPLIYGEGTSSALLQLQRELEGIPATGIVYTNNFTHRRTSLISLL